MPVFLSDTSGLDTFACECCGATFPKISLHEHHKIKRASGGQDIRENIAILCALCHHNLHQIEAAIKNEKRRLLVPEMLRQLYPSNINARGTCLYLATTAAVAVDSKNPTNKPAQDEPDYSVFDTPTEVHLTPPRVSLAIKAAVDQVCSEMRDPMSRRKIGTGPYLKMLLIADLRKRGYKV